MHAAACVPAILWIVLLVLLQAIASRMKGGGGAFACLPHAFHVQGIASRTSLPHIVVCLACLCAGGHAGYEIAPFIPTVVGLMSLLVKGPKAAPPTAFNTVQHHDMHHRFPNKHFSLYFTHWDRWLGTLHPQYDDVVQAHFEGKQQAAGIKDE